MPFVLQKLADEGTSDPFFARLWFGVFQLRDTILQLGKSQADFDKARQTFDQLYKPVLEATSAARTCAKEIQELITDHRAKLFHGTIIRQQGDTFELSESIDRPLRDKLAGFLVNGVIALKGQQEVVKIFGIDIGCLFKKTGKFEQGIVNLRAAAHTSLANYLVETRRLWTEQFLERRNSLEHGGWTVPRVEYTFLSAHSAEMNEPQVDAHILSSYCGSTTNRIMGFVENTVVYAFMHVLRTSRIPLVVVEIPAPQRDRSNPQRFRLAIKAADTLEWDIASSKADFV